MAKHAAPQQYSMRPIGPQRPVGPRRSKRRWPKVLVGIILTILAIAIALAAAIIIVRPQPAIDFLAKMNITVPNPFGQSAGAQQGSSQSAAQSATRGSSASQRSGEGTRGLAVSNDRGMSGGEVAEKAEKDKASLRTPLLARCSGVDMRSPVPMADLTGVLFHQASYDYALGLESEVPAADYERIADTRTFNINHDQVAGPNDWADTEILYIWRTTDSTDVNTSIDVGGLPGTTVRSPIDGTVVLVKNYRLYDEIDDVEIHIQPTGRSDLDCVLIHLNDPRVKAGDKVEAGITELATIRDIESQLSDVQLGFFTPEGVGGNHTHVQMNNANAAEYREKKLEGAITPA